eukprot:TRINITY_DN681_c0_g1_i7.p1 TRINITY_DN681_c0_g1~~TRINITY_DN681_c0_g1_i7.p1  ORF type:complete len:100 (+),score=31.88 TRINITY_DN681_c0_g1_i7:388-687(+)
MVKDAEKFKKDDDAQRARAEARHEFEEYIYQVQNTLGSGGPMDNVNNTDKKKLETTIDEMFQWLDINPSANIDDFKVQQKNLESVWNPIITKAYSKQSK